MPNFNDKCNSVEAPKQNGIECNENDKTKYPDGRVKLRNPHIEHMHEDILYHLALGTRTHNLVEMFSDIKFVCMGGSAERMETFARFIMKEIDYKLPAGTTLLNISELSHRYCMYKIGPVLSVSHGMGIASIGILLHEIIKLMYHSKVKDPIFFRIGTCGGLGVQPGTVVVSKNAVSEMLEQHYTIPVLGKLVQRPAKLDQNLVEELLALGRPEDKFETITGTTMCAGDFYEGQGRLDGAFCDYSESDKMQYLQRLRSNGVKNIEMEATNFAAITHHAGIKAAIVCVTLVDRFDTDQVHFPKDLLTEWQSRPQEIVGRYIKQYIKSRSGK